MFSITFPYSSITLLNLFVFEVDNEEKIKTIYLELYAGKTTNNKELVEYLKKLGYNNLPICIAKTQYSFSDDAKNLLCQEPFTIHVKEVVLKTGAEFVVVKAGKIMTMPGLPKVPSAESIYLDDNGEVVGIF